MANARSKGNQSKDQRISDNMIKSGGVTNEFGSVVLDFFKIGDEILQAISKKGTTVVNARQKNKGRDQSP